MFDPELNARPEVTMLAEAMLLLFTVLGVLPEATAIPLLHPPYPPHVRISCTGSVLRRQTRMRDFPASTELVMSSGLLVLSSV